MENDNKYLLDTHFFIWWLTGDNRLQSSTKDIIKNPGNIVYASVVSAWEMSIKLKANPKFKLRVSIKKAFEIAGFDVLDISLRHVISMHKLPLYHKDPFDRMLIAQANAEGCILITKDPKIKKYKVKALNLII